MKKKKYHKKNLNKNATMMMEWKQKTLCQNLITTSSTNKNEISLSCFTSGPEIKKDAEFLNKFNQVMENSDTSKLFILYMSQFRATFWKAQNSIKKQIEAKESANRNTDEAVEERSNNVAEAEVQPTEPALQPNEDETTFDMNIDVGNKEPDIGQYWEISHVKDSIYAQVVVKDLSMVNFFEQNLRSTSSTA